MSLRQQNLQVFAVLFTIVSIILMFLHINFDPQVGGIFTLFIVIAAVLTILNRRIDIPLVRPGSKPVQIILYSVGGYFAFVIASTLVGQYLGLVERFSLLSTDAIKQVTQLYAQYIPFFAQTEPLLAGQPQLLYLAFAILIPIAETIVFIKLFEAIHDWAGVTPNLKRLITWTVLAGISIGFGLFHLTAKGLQDKAEIALSITIIFMAISLVVATIRKQSVEAINMHIIANSIAVTIALTIGLGIPVIIAVVTLALFIALSNQRVQRTLAGA